MCVDRKKAYDIAKKRAENIAKTMYPPGKNRELDAEKRTLEIYRSFIYK